MSTKANVLNAEDALSLPQGELAVHCIQTSISPESVYKAAQLLIDKGDSSNLQSQADVIVRAGTHGYGAGDAYDIISHRDTEPSNADEQILNLAAAEDVLKLQRGRLAVHAGILIEASFSDTEAVSAAQTLIEHEDAANLLSQAQAIARAGKHGWGQGDKYETI